MLLHPTCALPIALLELCSADDTCQPRCARDPSGATSRAYARTGHSGYMLILSPVIIFYGLFGYPVGPQGRPAAGEQWLAVQHCFNEICDAREMDVLMGWDFFAALRREQCRTVQGTQFEFARRADDAEFVPLHARVPAHIHDGAHVGHVFNQD